MKLPAELRLKIYEEMGEAHICCHIVTDCWSFFQPVENKSMRKMNDGFRALARVSKEVSNESEAELNDRVVFRLYHGTINSPNTHYLAFGAKQHQLKTIEFVSYPFGPNTSTPRWGSILDFNHYLAELKAAGHPQELVMMERHMLLEIGNADLAGGFEWSLKVKVGVMGRNGPVSEKWPEGEATMVWQGWSEYATAKYKQMAQASVQHFDLNFLTNFLRITEAFDSSIRVDESATDDFLLDEDIDG